MSRHAFVSTIAAALLCSGTTTPAAPPTDAIAQPGDAIELHGTRLNTVFVARDVFSYDKMIRFLYANDMFGLKKLIRRERVQNVQNGTRGTVIERYKNPVIGRGLPALKVQILDGSLRGEFVWVPASQAIRHEPGPNALARSGMPMPKLLPEPPSESRSAVLLSIGWNLERSRKVDAAMVYYRRILEEFPGTTEARKASERIHVLEGKADR